MATTQANDAVAPDEQKLAQLKDFIAQTQTGSTRLFLDRFLHKAGTAAISVPVMDKLAQEMGIPRAHRGIATSITT